MALENPSIAHFDAQYSERLAPPTWPICDDMLMIEPGHSGGDHAARHGLRGEERRPHVQAHHMVEILDRNGGERIGPVGAGIVDKDAVRLGGSHRLRKGRNIGDIKRQPVRGKAGGAQRCGALLDFACGAGAQRDMGAGFAKAAATAAPMPRPAPVTSARRPSRRNDGVFGIAGAVIPRRLHKECCGRHSGEREYWPARHVRQIPPACTAASSIRRSWWKPRRSAPADR